MEKNNKINDVDLNRFGDGALAEKFNQAFQTVLENIADPNTLHKTKRKLILELEFTVDESRDLSVIDISTKTKLAHAKAASTKIIIDKDGKGNIIASEYGKQIKGQQYLGVDLETGEVLVDRNEMNEIDLKGIKLVK